MDIARPDRSFKTQGVDEETLQITRYLNSQQVIFKGVLDGIWENGEGELDAHHVGVLKTDLHEGLYQWVRIYKDKEHRKAIATFYLWTVNGVLERMWLARARSNQPPNPLDEIINSYFIPSLAVEQEGDRPRPHEKSPVASLRSDLNTDYRGSQGLRGMKPTPSVKRIQYEDYDHMWIFPKFRVRSTILAPVLLKWRTQGEHKIDLGLLQKAIDREREQR